MLVLSRKKDQAIVIGEQITVSIIDIQGDNVRIGISAPLDIRIYRQEIYDEIQEENRKAAENLDKLKKQVQNLKDYKNYQD
ncbi:carbon storage regulator CsrA [Syntrophomonas wolfei]|jgi:carbon storage regulator|uniref:carbon storage regulator CsrA n=1 Tax=Syntrophomonas wolfei TaxID=863 RepID=UPI000772FB7F|nr:carbon storage regulator CsrA [Syntrophomonas wolfei]